MRNTYDDYTNFSRSARPGSIKRKAATYLGIQLGQPLSKADERLVVAKAHKIKDHGKKAERKLSHQLLRAYE